MKRYRMAIDPASASFAATGKIDPDRVDATTEEEIARQKAEDDKAAMQDAARADQPHFAVNPRTS